MSLKSGIIKDTADRILGRPAAYRTVALVLGLVAASSVAISAANVSEPAKAKTVSEPCSCGCPYCCADEPTEGIGRVKLSAKAPVSDTLDYTDGVIRGWGGRYCDLWEMELFSKIMYLEFWGCSPECCEAGVDSVLRLLESGYYGNSLGGLLSAVCETGEYVYSPYGYYHDWNYDEQGLADMRALCTERFQNGPVWIAAFFRKGAYHDWGEWTPTPCYNMDNVYFSTFKK